MSTSDLHAPSGDGASASIKRVSSDIAHRLGEYQPTAIGQIRAIVRRCGVEQARHWLDEVIAIEEGGGMVTANGQRRRTLGGVFFAHVYQELRAAGRTEDLAAMKRTTNPRTAMRAANHSVPAVAHVDQPSEPPISWEGRKAAWDSVTNVGVTSAVKFRVLLAPQQELVTSAQTLLPVVHRGAMSQDVRGAPLPPEPLATSYLVAIGGKPWRKLGERAPGATLQLRGFAYDDAKLQTLRLIAIDPPAVIDAKPEKPVKRGETRTPVFTVIGTVGTPLVRPDVVLVRLRWRGPFPSVPGGIALPTTVPALEVGVIIGAKLWGKQGASALVENAEAKYIFEGAGYMDRTLGMLIVHATGITMLGRKPDALGTSAVPA